MQFTLWPSLFKNEGGHTDLAWADFLAFLSKPQIVADKSTLEGWSPARFAGNKRSVENVKAVSCIGLDYDKANFSTEQLFSFWSACAGAIHTTHSHTLAAPRHRVVLRLSRDVTAEEYAIVWRYVHGWAASNGHVLDQAAKDASRFWYVPAHREGAPYTWCELPGAALDVDAILASVPPEPAPAAPAPVAMASAPDAVRTAAASALAAGWPPDGQRREAHMALAGALRAQGLPEDEAVAFVCDVYRALGDERPKTHAGIVRQTYEKPSDAPVTGWTRLQKHVGADIVAGVRKMLGGEAAFEQRMAEAAGVSAPVAAPSEGLGFEYGAWDQEPPPTDFLVDCLIPRGSVGMFFGRADALKTWLLFSLGLAVATGKPWLGRFGVTKALKVGIVDFETGRANVDRRLFMLRAGTCTNLGRKSFAALKPNDPAFWLALALEGFDLVIIDSLRKANPGANENDSDESIKPLTRAAEFAELTGCAVYFVHHAKKDSSDGWPEFRGSGAIEDQVDCAFSVRKTDITAERKTVEIRCEKPGDMRKPEPFSVEVIFDDVKRLALLSFKEPEKTVKSSGDDNRSQILKRLRDNPSGVPKDTLIDALTGTEATRRKDVADLILAGIVIEFPQKEGPGRPKIYVMLNPNAPN